MAHGPAGTYETYEVEGMREDLGPIVYNIDPIDTPFMNSISRATATQIKQEWQTDVLDTAAFNAVTESNLSAFTEPVQTSRPHNNLQISEKTLSVSGTLQKVTLAGRPLEIGYQLARLAKSLKRDCEFTLSQNQAIDDGAADGATNRTLASYETWMLAANSNRGAGGAIATQTVAGQPDDSAQPTDGTQRALQESFVQSVIQACWTAGGEIDLMISGPYNKRIISGFAGNSTRFDIGEDKRLTSTISVLISDYGEHRIVASRFSRDRSVLIMDTQYWAMSFLRPFQSTPLGKIGDSEQHLMNVEYTLLSFNNKGSGVVADLTTS